MAAVALAIVAWIGLDRSGPRPPEGFDIAELLRNEAGNEGFERPSGDWHFSFPDDHGAHPGFRSEIWSLKGYLRDQDGRGTGFALVFLRLALKPGLPERDSAWASHQVYAAQLTLVDPSKGGFDSEDRYGRGALGLSGAGDEPVRIWVEDWSITATDSGELNLRARTEGGALNLDLEPVKPVLKQGELDLGSLAAGVGGGVHFYLIPRLESSGTLKRDGRTHRVTGHAWFDHAWGDVPVARGQVALDRFSLHLDDGRDLLCLRLRRRDGTGTPVPSCLVMGEGRAVEALRRRDVLLEPVRWWKSPQDGSRYPIGWKLALRRMGLEIVLHPLVEDQELTQPLRVWSGAVLLQGKDASGPLTGWGFVELTGYGKVDQSSN